MKSGINPCASAGPIRWGVLNRLVFEGWRAQCGGDEPIRRDLRSFGLKIERYPCRSMVAGVQLPTRPSVYTTVHEPVRHLRREQKVIESHAFVLLPPFKFVIPECPERPVRMQPPHRVGPALRQQTRKGLAAFGLDQ